MHYYNEFDPDMADWLRVLMAEGFIPVGDVDERSILDVEPTDLRGYVQCHFFAGLGGWPLALRLAGVPISRRIWTGSCPCQPFSCAGKRRGTMDSRHLWPVWVRLIAESNGLYGVPTVFGEQVASADGRVWLAGVRASLENLAYAFGGADLCSASVGAPNIRQRLFWVAQSHLTGEDGRHRQDSGWQETHSEPGTCGEVLRLANAEPANRRPEQSESAAGQRWCRFGRGGWMGEPIQPGLEGHAGNGDNGSEPGRLGETATRPTAAASDLGGVANAYHGGRATGCSEKGPSKADVFTGLKCAPNFWSDSIWHLCRDGKQRRIPVEPAFFPLAARLPGRVAMLKGFGNAINPVTAAEFIKGCLEALK